MGYELPLRINTSLCLLSSAEYGARHEPSPAGERGRERGREREGDG